MSIYYRFAHENDRGFEQKTIQLSGLQNSMLLSDVKMQIAIDNNIRLGREFDLQVMDSMGLLISGDNTQILKDTHLVIRRIAVSVKDNIVVNLSHDRPDRPQLTESGESDEEEEETVVDPFPFPSLLKCTLCNRPFNDPVLVKCDAAQKCGFSACKQCVELAVEKDKHCPNFKCTGRFISSVPNVALTTVVGALKWNFFFDVDKPANIYDDQMSDVKIE